MAEPKDQITINISDSLPPENQATIDLSGKTGNTYNKAQLDEKLNDAKSGVKGNATQANAPYNTDSCETYRVIEPITTASAWGIEVTADFLEKNSVYFIVQDGVVSKFSQPIKGAYQSYLNTTTDNPKLSEAEWVADQKGEDGSTTFQKWEAKSYPELTPVEHEGKYYILGADKIAISTDIPGESDIWESLGKDTNVTTALKSFLGDAIYWEEISITDILDSRFVTLTFEQSNVSSNWQNGRIPVSELAGFEFLKIVGDFTAGAPVMWLGAYTPTTILLSGAKTETEFIYDINFSFTDYYASILKGNTKIYKGKKGNGISEEDSVLNYINLKVSQGAKRTSGTETINIFDYNGVGSGTNDDTPQFNQAVLDLISIGGGKIILPDSKTFAVSNIEIPPLADNWIPIEFDGLVNPSIRFGTIGSYPNINENRGATIFSFADNPSKGIINVQPYTASAFDPFSAVHLVVKNLNIRSLENPNTLGINAEYAYSLIVENVDINTGVYNVQAEFPTNFTTGIFTPKVNNAGFTDLRNVGISGFRVGITVGEHTSANNVFLSSCGVGLQFKLGGHASYFGRVGVSRCNTVIQVLQKHFFEIAQLNVEYVGSGQFTPETAWQKTVLELNDSSNLGVGKITYNSIRGAFGQVPTFRMDGGQNVIVKRIGSETRLTGAGIPDNTPIN